MSFPCTSCGLCCKVLPAYLGFPLNEKGFCVHLGENDRCMIYDDRPALCRVDALRPDTYSEKQWHELNAGLCNTMQEATGTDEEFRVVIE